LAERATMARRRIPIADWLVFEGEVTRLRRRRRYWSSWKAGVARLRMSVRRKRKEGTIVGVLTGKIE
jgi:hypothetical protein